MAGSKLTALKTASHDLVDILFGEDTTAENLWIGVVPFSQTVNIGTNHSAWLDQTHFSSLNWGTTSWAGCVDARYSAGRDVTDDPPYDLLLPNANPPAVPYERLKAYYWPDETNASSSNNDWMIPAGTSSTTSICSNSSNCTCAKKGPCGPVTTNGITTDIQCGGSGGGAYCNKTTTYVQNAYNITSSDTPNLNCPSAITPLTNTKATVEAGIDALVARGNTHVGFGAVWGWRLISPRWRGYWGGAMDTNNLPLNYNSPLMSKAVIVMTDGANTMSGASSDGKNPGIRTAYGYLSEGNLGSTSSSAAVSKLNSNLTSVCNSMKAQGVVVYTILFQETNNTIKTLMKGCATTPDHFFDSPTAESLQSAFQTIGDSLANLRISK